MMDLDHNTGGFVKASPDNDQQMKKEMIHFVNVMHTGAFLPILDIIGGDILII